MDLEKLPPVWTWMECVDPRLLIGEQEEDVDHFPALMEVTLTQ